MVLRNGRGVIIIAALWICAIIMWIALEISADTRLRAEEETHLVRKSQALFLAVGGANEALARMGTAPPVDLDRESLPAWQPDGIAQTVLYKSGEAIVIIEDESRKVNVNLAQPDNLQAVLERAGLEIEDVETLADTIADFLDKDDIPQLHGAEKDQYKQMGIPYLPFNNPLSSTDQLLLVPGIDASLFYGYGSKMTSQGKKGAKEEYEEVAPLDPMLPASHSLFSMLTVFGSNTILQEDDDGLSDFESEGSPSLSTSRDGRSGTARTSSSREDETNLRTAAWTPGGIYRILSCGRASTGPPSVVLCLIVRYAPGSETGYEVLYRKTL